MVNNSLNIQNLYSNMSQRVINRADRLYSSGVNQLKSLQPFFDRVEPKVAPCIKLIRRAVLPLIQRPVALCAIVGVTIVCVDSFVDSVVRKILNVRWVIFSNELSKFVARSGVGFLALKTITVVTGVPLNNEDLFIFLVAVIVLKQLINDCREIKDLAIKLFAMELKLIATKKLANK